MVQGNAGGDAMEWKRINGSDGKAYTKVEFLKFYQGSTVEWDKSSGSGGRDQPPTFEGGSAWMYHMDNSVLGETYAKCAEIECRRMEISCRSNVADDDGRAFARFAALRN